MDEKCIKFGNTIKTARRRAGYTQVELAGIAKVNQGTISHLENGMTAIQIFAFMRIIEALGLDFIDVLKKGLWEDGS